MRNMMCKKVPPEMGKVVSLPGENHIFASLAPSKTALFSPKNRSKIVLFSQRLLEPHFSNFQHQKTHFSGPTWSPTWGQKPHIFLQIGIGRPATLPRPPKTPKTSSRTPPRLLQTSPKRVQSITFRPNLAKSVSFSQILAQQHNKSTFKILTGPNTQYAFHFSLLYIRGTLVSVYPPPRSALGT